MTYQTIGTNAARIDAPGKVTGKTLYPGDIAYPDMLHMATLFADRPHARILSIDTSEAEAAPGVVAVFTAKDVPVNLYGLQIKDQPVLCGPGSDKPGADVVRCVGDQMALVVAETEAQARAACKLIRIEWEDLPLVLDPEEAAPSLAGGLVAPDPARPVPYQLHPHCPDNVCYGYRIRKGDVAAGFREADIIIEGVYQTPVQEHAYLQPEAGVAYLDDEGRITVEVAGQWTHEDQGQIAHALGIPKEQVRVIYPAIGGAFGGREDMSVQITLALAVWRLAQRGIKRPIKTIWSREESIIGHGKRHAMKIYTRWGAKQDGKLTAVEVKVIADGGAYMYTSNKVLGNTTLTCTGPYDIPHVAVDTHAVYTNNVPGAAFRGFGGPQGHFAAESQMDKLAEALGIDPVELRLKNVITDETILSVGTPIPGGVGMTATIITAAKAAGWTQDEAGHWHKPAMVRGQEWRIRSQDSGYESGGDRHRYANTQLPSHTRPRLRCRLQERRLQLWLPGEQLRPRRGARWGRDRGCHALFCRSGLRTGEPYDYRPGGGRGAGSAVRTSQSNCLRHIVDGQRRQCLGVPAHLHVAATRSSGAAEKALAAWKNEDRPAVGEFTYLAPKTTKLDPETGHGLPNFAYGYVAQVAVVAVDTETGQVKVERFISADDVGQAINPQQVIGQIEGAAVQALGYAVLEEFKTAGGRVLTDKFSTYLIPTVLDVPDRMDALIVEVPDPNGPFGARGMGEMPYLPAAAAVAAAVFDATGVRFDEFPLTPERVWRGLRKGRISG